ncbi:MAG: hypothetical protein JSV79_07495, partial [Armatimonadota bacterium]
MSSDGKDGVFLRVVAVAAACLCLAFGSVALAATYYVDSVNGNDDYDGTSPSTAWQSLEKVNGTTFQPGDQILLKADCVWTGQLWPKGSGAAGNPIMIDMYGTGAKPLINGDGLVQSTVYLYNQEYWEVSNLEITNWDPAGPDIRQGVYVVGHEYTPGVLNHIHLKDLVVHDVNGHDTDGRNLGKCNGGIIFDVWGCPISVRFNDVLVEGCYVYHVDRSGIKTWSDNTRWYEDPELPWYWQPYTNMVIRNNVLDDIGGDGIVTCHADAPLVEYNVASNCQARSNEFNVAIWPWDCDDAMYQYNEAYLTHQTKDGQGYDIDGYNNRATLQYNYSHDNEGGFILICGYGAFNRDSVLRYNISEDDHIPNVGSIL